MIWKDPSFWGFMAFLLVLGAMRKKTVTACSSPIYALARALLVAAVVVLAFCLALCASLAGIWGYAGALVLLTALMKKRKGGYTTLGDGRFATRQDIPHMLDASTGLCVGVMDGRRSLADATRALFHPDAEFACRAFLEGLFLCAARPVVRLVDAVHSVIVAPPGAGKSTALVIPFLLSLAFGDDSAFVVDVKGELARTCGPVLQEAGVKVYVVDHHKVVTRNPHSFDPVMGVRAGSHEVMEESKAIAEDLIPVDPNESQPHWPRIAKQNLSAIIAYVVEFGGQFQSLQTAIGTVMNRQYRAEAIKRMQASDKQGGLLARAADEISHAQGDELNSALSTLATHLSPFSTPALVEGMRTSTFDPRVLKQERSVVFFVLEPTRLETERGVLRMWLGSTIRALMLDGLGGRIVHGVIDEAAAVGAMKAIDTALSVGRSYGLRIQTYWQAMPQMETVYPHGQHLAVLAQCTQVYFGVQDVNTATHIEKSLGPQTVIVEGGGDGCGGSDSTPYLPSGHNTGSRSTSWNGNSNWSQQSRPLLYANQVMTLARRTAITISPGCHPLMTTLVPYFEEPWLCAPRKPLSGKALAVSILAVALACVTAKAALGVVRFPHFRKAVSMSAKELHEELEAQKSMGPMAAARDVIKAGMGALADGAKAVVDAAYSDGVQHFVAHGSHEGAAALFNGNGFVMYPRGTRDDHGNDGHGVHGDLKAPETPQVEQQNENDRGGRSR